MDKAKKLQVHVIRTYSNLRYGLAVIGFLFAPFLWVVGLLWHGIPWQSSMSAYYYAETASEGPIRSWLTSLDFGPINTFLFVLGGLDSEVPMRSWFVGILFVLGIFLYLYKGFSAWENILLNIAGLSALGVALFPMEWGCTSECHEVTVHAICAVIVFISMGAVALWCSDKSLKEWGEFNKLSPADQIKLKAYHYWYKLIGLSMILFPLVAWFLISQIFNDNGTDRRIFFIEWFGIVAFALYWLIKSNEISEKQTDTSVAERKSRLPSDRPGLGAEGQVDAPLAETLAS